MAPRLVLLLVLLALTLAVYIISFWPEPDRNSVYGWLGFWTHSPSFYDTYFVLTALDCHRAGLGPREVCATLRHGFVYPKTFYLLLPLGLTARDRIPVAIFLMACFVASLFVFFRLLSWRQCAYVSLAVAAPPAWLALDRANADLLILALLAAAAILLEERKWSGGAAALIVLAGLLKLYPVAALAGVAARISWRLWAVAVATCAAGLAVQWDHLTYVVRSVPRIQYWSFGYPVMGMAAREWLARTPGNWTVPAGADAALWAAAVAAAVVLALWLYRRGCPGIAALPHAPGFLLGAASYAFCWFAGVNFFYRYILLLLTLPFLFAASARPVLRPLARAVLAALLPMLWLTVSYPATIVRESLALVLASAFLAVLVVAGVQTLQPPPADGIPPAIQAPAPPGRREPNASAPAGPGRRGNKGRGKRRG